MNMDEKQWLVSRLDTTTKTIFDEFQLSKEDFIRIRGDLISSITSKRNYVLSSVVFVSVLLATLYDAELITTTWFLSILISDLIVGLITFFVASKYVQSIQSTFINIENSIVHAQQTINRNFGSMIHDTLELIDVDISTIREYGEFLRALSGIVYIPFANALIQGSRSKLLDVYYRNSFIEYVKEFEKLIESAILVFNKMNKTNIQKQLLDDVVSAISAYRNNHPQPNRDNPFNLKPKINTLVLSSHDLLQIDATVIAGLLILLTLQGTSSNNDLSFIDGEIMNRQIINLQGMLKDNSESPKMVEKINDEIMNLKIEEQNLLIKTQTKQQFAPLSRIVDPSIPFLFSMGIFILSAIAESYRAVHQQETSSKFGRVTMYMGFVFLLASTVLMVSHTL